MITEASNWLGKNLAIILRQGCTPLPITTTPPITTSSTSAPLTTPPPPNFEPLTCVGCPAGFFLEQESLNCTACPPGSSTRSFKNASSALDCLCQQGFENQTDATCVLCLAGTYKATLDNASCTLCPANSTTPSSGETNATQCVCKPGYTHESNLRPTPPPPENAVLIWNNEYNESLTNASLSNASLYDTSYNAWDCVACADGTYKTPIGLGVCLPCPADHYCPSPSVLPIPCPVNTSAVIGSASVYNCLCADGFVIVYREDSYMCAVCDADTYYTRNEETSVGICVSCPANTGSAEGSRSQ